MYCVLYNSFSDVFTGSQGVYVCSYFILFIYKALQLKDWSDFLKTFLMKALTNSTQLVQPSENSFSKASAAMAQAQSGFHQSVESLQQVQVSVFTLHSLKTKETETFSNHLLMVNLKTFE